MKAKCFRSVCIIALLMSMSTIIFTDNSPGKEGGIYCTICSKLLDYTGEYTEDINWDVIVKLKCEDGHVLWVRYDEPIGRNEYLNIEGETE